MPNWCTNTLSVTKSTPKLEAFLKEHGLSFAAINPCPAEVSDQVEAWGTKWDLTPEDATQSAEDLLNHGACGFVTAWSPPSKAIRVLSKITDACFELTFYEPGCWFWGKEVIEDGDIYGKISGESDSKEKLREFLTKEMGYSPSDAYDEVFGLEEEP
jgi:hypothetical protein